MESNFYPSLLKHWILINTQNIQYFCNHYKGWLYVRFPKLHCHCWCWCWTLKYGTITFTLGLKLFLSHSLMFSHSHNMAFLTQHCIPPCILFKNCMTYWACRILRSVLPSAAVILVWPVLSMKVITEGEGDKVILYTVWREKESRSNSTSVDVNLLMSFCWCHSVDVHWDKLISLYWYHSKNYTLWTSLCWCFFIDVTLLMSILWCHSINNKIWE